MPLNRVRYYTFLWSSAWVHCVFQFNLTGCNLDEWVKVYSCTYRDGLVSWEHKCKRVKVRHNIIVLAWGLHDDFPEEALHSWVSRAKQMCSSLYPSTLENLNRWCTVVGTTAAGDKDREVQEAGGEVYGADFRFLKYEDAETWLNKTN